MAFQLITDRIVASLEDLLQSVLSDDVAPPPPTGADAWAPPCRPRRREEITTAAASEAVTSLARSYHEADAWWQDSTSEIGLFTSSDPRTTGRMRRHPNPAGYDFRIELNLNRLNPTHYDLALSLIHELAHVDHVRRAGFLPVEVATLAGEEEYVALAWQYELVAYRAMLAGARAIRDGDPDAFRECWHVSVADDAVLAALNGDDLPRARREIQDLYPESDLRAEWAARQGGPPPTDEIVPLWLAYYGLGHSDDPAVWGL